MKKMNWESTYQKIKEIGAGGNGCVYEVSKIGEAADEHFALKFLKFDKVPTEKKNRFIKEIKTVSENLKNVQGIIPILDSSEDDLWYVMPKAVKLTEYIKNTKTTFDDIIKIAIDLSKTLKSIHDLGFSHRDIKPDNILWYNGKPSLCDFGLVKDESDTANLTKNEKNLGAKFTIAPEMKRNPYNSDGKKADIYSFAKTIWMLLTGDELGFEGTYNFEDSKHSLRQLVCDSILPNIDYSQDDNTNKKMSRKMLHLVELEELLKNATSNDVELRPDIDTFINRLENYLEIKNDSDKSQRSDWQFLSKYLFNGITPKSAEWTDRNQIVRVLNFVGSIPSFNHTFLPSKGGVDFEAAAIPSESYCLELRFDFETSIVKPKSLYFESFGDESTWNYFLLETGNLAPVLETFNSFNGEILDEWLCEDLPGHYISDKDFVYGVYDYDSGEKLPESARRIVRYLHGNFLFALKWGDYNKIASVYDGRHSAVTPKDFRRYCDTILEFIHVDETKREILLESDFPNVLFEKCFPKPKQENREEEKKPVPYKFIKENILKWDYTDIINKYSSSNYNSAKIGFYFEFNKTSTIQFSELGNQKCFYISPDSSFYETDFWESRTSHKDFSKIFMIYNRHSAINFKDAILSKISEECKSNGYDDDIALISLCVSVCIKRFGTPEHLFTIDELETEIRKADDRHDNNLVIDENGYVHVIEADLCHPHLYPVSNGVWCARNCYTGKYANLDKSYLQMIYKQCLKAWCKYLEIGEHISISDMDSITSDAEDILLDKIKEYYEVRDKSC